MSASTWIVRASSLIALLTLAACGGGGGGSGGGGTGGGGSGGGSAVPPTISAQPAAATVADGASASFSTVAAGNAPLVYQWRRNDTDLVDGTGVSGATSAALTLTAPYAFNASQISVRVSNAAGNVVSNNALLTVTPIAPTITTQPQSASVVLGAPATFSALISGGTAPVTYQWKRDGVAVADATSASYTVAATALTDDNAALVLDVINPAGTLSSAAATLKVLVAPSITKQPANLSVTVGAPATFSVELTDGTPPVLFQWKRNGTSIIGAVDRSYTIPATEMADNGATFAVDIVSPAGPLSSVPATLTVTAAGPGINLNVNTTDDRIDDDTSDGVCHTSANTCSLRAAIMQANRLTGPLVRINVPAGVYTLTRPPTGTDDESSGNLNISPLFFGAAAIVISGAGASSTIIDANQMDNVIHIAQLRIVTLSGITVRDGKPLPLPDGKGGGIYNLGHVTVTDCVIEGNQADNFGGGIYSSGTLKVIRSTIRFNTARYGGGLDLDGPATVRDSTVHGNHADEDGGGIRNNALSMYVVNSTVSQNTADTNGGGIVNAATVALYNTTVTDNDADHDRDENGGIGGGVFNVPGSRFIVGNSLIARNTLVDSPRYNDCNGTFELYGKNLFGDFECTHTGIGELDLISVDSGMDTMLRDNGGPTLTLALPPGSTAIDSTITTVGCIDEKGDQLTTDQRGAPRVAGAKCDIGAYEFGAVVP
jgi:predicted outer membrane repeat protein